jgi:SnoaL-like domain
MSSTFFPACARREENRSSAARPLGKPLGMALIERIRAAVIASEWLDAWNGHRPDLVVAHFADDVVVASPLAERIRPGSGGILRGKAEVLSYYDDGLAAVGDLRFTLVETLVGVDQVTIVYRDHRGVLAAETLTLRADGSVGAVSVAYGDS